nr:RNA-directed DNA polymerase, eukaryota, reverse transcriptase zinc-binding domain protein [Tanacetum cinerariifolium]
MVEQAWLSFFHNDSNSLIRFKKKLQDLKKVIRVWIRDMNILKEGVKNSLTDKLVYIDKELDNGVISDDMLLNLLELSCKLYELNKSNLKDAAQKAKHTSFGLKLNMSFPNHLTSDQFDDLERNITRDEIKVAVWDCGENKSPGPDGFTFVFFRHFWDLIDSDLCAAVNCFFDSGSFSRGHGVHGYAVFLVPIWRRFLLMGVPLENGPMIIWLFRLSMWKAKTLSIGGRLMLLKSGLGVVLIYTMSIYKAPKGVLYEMEMIRNKFFVGADSTVRKSIGLLGIKCWLLKNMGALVFLVIMPLTMLYFLNGSSIESHAPNFSSCWNSILHEIHTLALKGFNFLSHCKIHVGNGLNTIFWPDTWISNLPLSIWFPYIFALERTKAVSVAIKRGASSLNASFRRQVRDGVESHQWSELNSLLGSFIFSPSSDRWSCDLNVEGMFRVKDILSVLDDLFLPSSNEATRWANYVLIKVNVFAWRARLDRLPTRDNLAKKELSWIHPYV